jgi:hypothetical protein
MWRQTTLFAGESSMSELSVKLTSSSMKNKTMRWTKKPKKKTIAKIVVFRKFLSGGNRPATSTS